MDQTSQATQAVLSMHSTSLLTETLAGGIHTLVMPALRKLDAFRANTEYQEEWRCVHSQLNACSTTSSSFPARLE